MFRTSHLLLKFFSFIFLLPTLASHSSPCSVETDFFQNKRELSSITEINSFMTNNSTCSGKKGLLQYEKELRSITELNSFLIKAKVLTKDGLPTSQASDMILSSTNSFENALKQIEYHISGIDIFLHISDFKLDHQGCITGEIGDGIQTIQQVEALYIGHENYLKSFETLKNEIGPSIALAKKLYNFEPYPEDLKTIKNLENLEIILNSDAFQKAYSKKVKDVKKLERILDSLRP